VTDANQGLQAQHLTIESGGTTMSFDALTIAGILSAALSGGFLIATAGIQAARRSGRRRPSPDDGG
jgi:hypothetical protein